MVHCRELNHIHEHLFVIPFFFKATLVFLLDHLSLVVSASERNKMSAQALATVMGPPLMLHSANNPSGTDVDHAQPIAVLKYLLQIWPQPQNAAAISGNVTISIYTPSTFSIRLIFRLLFGLFSYLLLLLYFRVFHLSILFRKVWKARIHSLFTNYTFCMVVDVKNEIRPMPT